MIGNNPLARAAAVVATSDAIGATIPKAVRAAHERAQRIVTASRHLLPKRDELAAAVTAALDAGRDPAIDPDVQRVVVAAQLGDGVTHSVEDIAAGEMLAVFREHADAIVRAWSTPFDDAAATLSACHERIGDVALTDADDILTKGGDIAEVWATARGACATLDSISATWATLALLTRFASVDPFYAGLRVTNAEPAAYLRSDLAESRNVSAWDVLLAGLPLSLADGPEYQRRLAAVQSARAAIDATEPSRPNGYAAFA